MNTSEKVSPACDVILLVTSYLSKESVIHFLTELSSVDNVHKTFSVSSLNIFLIYHNLLCKSCIQVLYNSVFFYGVFLVNYPSLFLVFLYCSFLFCFNEFLISIFNTDLWHISGYQYLILMPPCSKDQCSGHMV